MNTKKIIEIQKEIFSEVKNLWELSDKWNKENLVLDNFLDELNMKKTPENRFVAYSRISDLRVEPLELYLKNIWEVIDKNNLESRIKIPNKLSDNRIVLDKAYNYTKRIYEDLWLQFIYRLKSEKVVSDFEFEIFKWSLNVWKAFNTFMPVWERAVKLQNDILDKKFNSDWTKIMSYLGEMWLIDVDNNGHEVDRCYSVLKWWSSYSYFDAFKPEISEIIFALEDFIDSLNKFEKSDSEVYINYLINIKDAFSETDTNKLLNKWREVDMAWMEIKWPLQIGHPLEYYEDKYRKAVAPEWDLRVLDTETLDSKAYDNISEMYEKLYTGIDKEKYAESYNSSKDNFNRVQLYISEPVLYFGAELSWMFSAQVVPNDEIVSKMFWKKIFAFPKMVLDSKRNAPKMKITKDVMDSDLYESYLKIQVNSKLYFDIYDIETIGHEYGHTLWLTETTESIMNKKTWNFKNIEEFKATAWGLVSYFMSEKEFNYEFNKSILVMHVIRSVWLLKYREVTDVLPYYNEVLIHLDIMFEAWIIFIKNNKIILNFSEENFNKLKQNYIFHYKKLISNYLDKNDAWDFLFDYVEVNSNWDNVSKNKDLQDFWNYYYDLYKKIGNEVA